MTRLRVTVARVAELVLHVGRHQHGVTGLYRVFRPLDPEDALSLDDVSLVLPGMYVLRAGSSGRMLNPQHHVVRYPVIGAEDRISLAFNTLDYRFHVHLF